MSDGLIRICRRQIDNLIWIDRKQIEGVTDNIIVMGRIDMSLGLLRTLRVLLLNNQQILFKINAARNHRDSRSRARRKRGLGRVSI